MTTPPIKRERPNPSPYDMEDMLESIAEIQEPLQIDEALRQPSIVPIASTMKLSSSGLWKRSQGSAVKKVARRRTSYNSIFTDFEDAKKGVIKSVDVRTIHSVRDLEELVRSYPGSKKEKVEYLYQLRSGMRDFHRSSYCGDHKNHPNMKFVPATASDIGTDPPIFLPPCCCDWTSKGEILHGITPLPIMFFESSRCVDIDDIHELNPFYPRKQSGTFFNYWGGFSLAFMRNFMRLPKELRHTIYELVAFSWAPDTPYPLVGTQITRHKIARRNIRPIFRRGTKLDGDDQYSQLSRHMEHKAGMLDYFREEEYRNLEAFCESLVKFEGRMYQTKSESIPVPVYLSGIPIPYELISDIPGKTIVGELVDLEREEQRSLGALNDFVAWLWDNVVLDMSSGVAAAYFRDSDPTNKGREIIIPAKIRRRDYEPREPEHIVPCKEANHHRWISHLTFSTLASHSRHRTTTIQQEFRGVIDVCEYIKLNLPCLRTLRVFVRMGPGQARQVIGSQGNLPWIKSIRSLPILEKFNYHVLVENPPAWKPKMERLSKGTLLDLTERVTEILEFCKPRVSM